MAKTPSLNASIRLVRRPAGRSRFGGTSLTGKACPGSFPATRRHTDLYLCRAFPNPSHARRGSAGQR